MDKIYLIGEIGQNHNGSVDLAKLLIDVVTRPIHDKLFGQDLAYMDAVKMTKRDLSEELTDSLMNRPYDNPNSFAKTYGAHRKILELSNEQHFECYQYALLLCFLGICSVVLVKSLFFYFRTLNLLWGIVIMNTQKRFIRI